MTLNTKEYIFFAEYPPTVTANYFATQTELQPQSLSFQPLLGGPAKI